MKPLPKPTESFLIDQALASNQKAYRELYEMNVEPLFRFLLQFDSNRDSVAEWVQSAFVAAFQNLHRFGRKSSFKTWLYKIALNEMNRTFRVRLPETSAMEPDSFPAEFSEPFASAELKRGLHRLEERHRSVLLLFEVEGYSHQEIAEILSIPENTSRSWLFRAKTQLKNLLDNEQHGSFL